jgi:hypothetical protein
VRNENLKGYIAKLEQQGIFRLGSSDLWIEAAENKAKYLLCHESDMHFQSSDVELIRRVIRRWLHQGYPLYVSFRPDGTDFEKRRWHKLAPKEKG